MHSMTQIHRTGFVFGITALCLAAGLAPALSQTYPDKPIRFIIPSPPGGGTDTLSRLIATKLSETLKWQIVPDNRPGAGGNIGMDLAAKAKPDGYTLVLGESANLTINPYLYTSIPFDPAKDLAPVVLVGTVPLLLVAAPKPEFDSVAALVAAAKSKSLTFASGGNGTVGHLTGELWKLKGSLNLRHIPYRGGAAAITDVLSGQVDLTFASIPSAAALVESGKLRALAVTSSKRLAQFPNVPTMEEAGFQGVTAQVVYGVMVPAGTPSPIVTLLNTEINKVLQEPNVKAALAKNGVDLSGGTPEEFGAFLNGERAKWAIAVKESGAKVD